MTPHAAFRQHAGRVSRLHAYTRLDLFIEADDSGCRTTALLRHLERVAAESGRLCGSATTADERRQAHALELAVRAAARIVRAAWASRHGRELGAGPAARLAAGVLS